MFESFNDFVNNEASNFNDPVLMKMRAAQMKANKKAAEKAAKSTKEISPAKQRKIDKLKAERAEVLRQMELDAGQAGSEWNDDMAQSYGEALNDIDKEIIKLGGNPLGASGFKLTGEAYGGNMSDFKYEFPQVFADVTGNPEEAIKKMAKKGKGFEVRTSTYMSREEMEEVANAMDMELVDYKKDSRVAVSVFESRIQLKRQYTENHPAITAGKIARVRNKMLEAIADGKLTKEEFDTILREMSIDSKRWMRRNTKYFNVSEDGITLSKFGRRALNQITINENMDNNTFLFESFNEFVNSSNTEAINEGTKGQFGIIDKKGNITSVYTHYDSYPEYMLPIIKRGYKDAKKVRHVIDMGDNSGLQASPRNMNFYGDDREPLRGNLRNWDAYVKDIRNEGGAEYVYLYNDAEDRWYMANVRSDARNRDLMPIDQYNESNTLFEATVEMDAMAPDDRNFLRWLDKNKVEIIKHDKQGPNNHPVITMQGKRKDLERVLADCKWGWCDEDLAEYIEESVVNEARVNISMSKFKKIVDKIGNDNESNHPFDRVYSPKMVGRDFYKNILDCINDGDYTNAGHEFNTGFQNSRGGEAADFSDELMDDLLTELGIDESVELNEAFKSSKLRDLVDMRQSGADTYGQKSKGLAAAIYGLSKIKLDQVEDSDLVDLRPSDAYKHLTKNDDYIVFYIIDNEITNPFADRNTYREPVLKPGILAVTRGKDFLGVHYDQRASRYGRDKRGAKNAYNMTYMDGDGAVGGNKKYRGYDASGIYTVKRAAELADRAIAFDITEMGKSAKDLIKQRAAAQSGAIAFKSAEDFKKANIQRYKDIIATKASKLPLDKIVEDSINLLTKHIADAMKSGERTKYKEIKIGEDKKGREIKITDASNIMSSILTAYERYVRYTAEGEREKESGYSSGYYEKEAKQQAKYVADYAKKVKNMDYAW